MSHPEAFENKLLGDITTRAAVDRTFREHLLDDPRSAMAEAIGQPVPENFQIKFTERDPEYDAVVVLPDLVDEEAELSPEELEAVAGGDCWITCITKSCLINTSKDETVEPEDPSTVL